MHPRIRWDSNERNIIRDWLNMNPAREGQSATERLNAAQTVCLIPERRRTFQSDFIARDTLSMVMGTGSIRSNAPAPHPLPVNNTPAVNAQGEMTLATFLQLHGVLKAGKYTVVVE